MINLKSAKLLANCEINLVPNYEKYGHKQTPIVIIQNDPYRVQIGAILSRVQSYLQVLRTQEDY